MLFEHLRYLKENDLLVLDRGYPGNRLIALLTQIGRHFCMGVDDTGYACVKAFKRSGRSEHILTLGGIVNLNMAGLPSRLRNHEQDQEFLPGLPLPH
jgi:hypothetical protein